MLTPVMNICELTDGSLDPVGQPSSVHEPAEGKRSPAMMWSKVVFPAPFSPRRRCSPGQIGKSTRLNSSHWS